MRMSKSIYCCECGKEKEGDGWAEKHFRCRACFSEQCKANYRKRMDAKGIAPKREGKSPACYWCGAVKENPRAGLCNPCRAKEARELRARKRAEKGLAPFVPGRKPECGRCGSVRENFDASYCAKCSREMRALQEAARAEKGLQSYNETRNPNCYSCGKKKENPKQGYCYDCKNAKEKSRKLANGDVKKHRTGKCACGSDFASYSKSKCMDCYRESRAKRKGNPDYIVQLFKESVRSLTRKYIAKGILTKQLCIVCGTNEMIEAHHEDYTKPLEVIWLCRNHHKQYHSGKISLIKD